MKKPDNPPAFPFEVTELGGNAGMTLLDYFAGKAMQGLMGIDTTYDNLAKYSYRAAQAMLKERAKHL
ncbi:hypothetical protein LCGC14_1345580 [marine sediment metagenome]|uniref:Uncharacterized protein n=1 Tax=marine sediment metagenome TaxID=412755 RepID=A0A0F9KD28_9ZZZZ